MPPTLTPPLPCPLRAWELGPEYGPCFLVGTVLYVCAGLSANNSPGGGAYYYLSAACNGLQNGMTSMYSSNLIRTTHLTGTTTDIGIILGQLARGHHKLAWKLYVPLSLSLSLYVCMCVCVSLTYEHSNQLIAPSSSAGMCWCC